MKGSEAADNLLSTEEGCFEGEDKEEEEEEEAVGGEHLETDRITDTRHLGLIFSMPLTYFVLGGWEKEIATRRVLQECISSRVFAFVSPRRPCDPRDAAGWKYLSESVNNSNSHPPGMEACTLKLEVT